MNQSPEVSACAAIHEAKTGIKPSQDVLCIVECIYRVGSQLEQIGLKHTVEGSKPLPKSEIQKLLRDAYNIESEDEITEYLHECYMMGYDSEKEVQFG